MAFDTSSQAKTLADMTTEERAECVGMWCDNLVSTADNPQPVVLACVQGAQCWILHTGLHGEWSRFSLGSVSPRPDLQRVWTPDGEPVEMVQEYGNGGWDEEVNEPYHWPMRSSACNGYCAPFDKAPAEYSRWVSDWEPVSTPRKINGMVNPHV